MYKYKLKLSGDPVEFRSHGPEGVLDAWRMIHKYPSENPVEWRKQAAAMACDWCGQPIRFDTDEAFAIDMMRHGMLEAVDAK